MKRALVTGSSGFIGFHLAKRLILEGFDVIGIDNMNSYYDTQLKKDRLSLLRKKAASSSGNFRFYNSDITDNESMHKIFSSHKPNYVVNLAAQAGVRYSIDNPFAYLESNIYGFGVILEMSKLFKVEHLLYASSSSVYGGNKVLPFSENDPVDHPISLYAASKKSNEVMAHTYSHLFELPTTGLRFFTVYGPWGRPDMALFKFTRSILSSKPIDVYNHGKMIRDFTYVDDVVESIFRLLPLSPRPSDLFEETDPPTSLSWCPFRVLNVGNSNPVPLLEYIDALQKHLGMTAEMNFLPMQPGDVESTASDSSKLISLTGFEPSTHISDGIEKFVEWYQSYYN